MSHDNQTQAASGPDPAAVQAQLTRILTSKPMARSESLSRFLRFVVEQTLEGRGDRLKEREVALCALERSDDFDARTDPIVRIQAGRLRRALADYYAGEGARESIRIELPKGTYQPTFRVFEGETVTGITDDSNLSTNGPCVAVLPLQNLNTSKEDDYFGIGLTQELVSALSSMPDTTIIAVPPPDEAESVADVAHRLNGKWPHIRFLLSGTWQKSAQTMLLRLQLTDTTSSAVIWTDRIKRDLSAAELIDMEVDVAQQVTRKISSSYGVIGRTLTSEAQRNRPAEISVFDAILRFRHYQYVVTDESRTVAIAALEQAVQIDPNFALCWAMLSEAVCDAYGLRIDCRPEVISRAKQLARRALILDANCQHAHWALAYSHFHARQRDDFLREAETTIELNPNDGYLVGIAAWALALVGEWERGLQILRHLMQQNPYYPTWMHLAPYLDHYRKGEFDQALQHAKLFNIPDLAWDPLLRAAACGQLNEPEQAQAALDELNAGFPEAAADPAHYLRGYIFIDELVDDVVDGLGKAGGNKSAGAITASVK